MRARVVPSNECNAKSIANSTTCAMVLVANYLGCCLWRLLALGNVASVAILSIVLISKVVVSIYNIDAIYTMDITYGIGTVYTI